jgi:hypothetical protein
MAVPITVKMPEPMTAPTPSAVSETGPRVFLRACSGRSDSEISLSMDLVRKICRASVLAPVGTRAEGSYGATKARVKRLRNLLLKIEL